MAVPLWALGGAVTSDRLVMAIDLLARQFTWWSWVGCNRVSPAFGDRPGFCYLDGGTLSDIRGVQSAVLQRGYLRVVHPNLPDLVLFGLAVWSLPVSSPRSGGRAARRRAWAGALLVLLSLALPLYVFAGTLPAVNQRSNREAERFWQPILAQDLPEDAVLVSNDRDEIMPMWYFQSIDGLKPGWLGMFPLIVREPGYQDVTQVIDRALDSGRPVFLVKPMPGLELKYRLGTSGPVVRIIAPHGLQPPQHALAASFDDVVRLTGYDVSYPTPDTLEIVLFWSADQPMTTEFSSYVHLVDDAGQTWSPTTSARWRLLPDDRVEAGRDAAGRARPASACEGDRGIRRHRWVVRLAFDGAVGTGSGNRDRHPR